MTTQRPNLPILGFAAYSGTGKTTLLEALLPKLTQAGLRIGILKHAHHEFDVDKPGKDSYRLRKAGATQMLVASRNRHALMTETPECEAQFDYLLSRFDQQKIDVILVEGFKQVDFAKIELHREALGKPWLHPSDSNIIAIAVDSKVDSTLPQLDINDLDAIGQFVQNYINNTSQNKSSKVVSCDALSPAFLSVAEGRKKILDAIDVIPDDEAINIKQSYGRVLSQTVHSPIDVPQYTNSAMDGFAIRGDDLEQESYRVVAEVMAGYSHDLPLKTGEAVKIMTGAPIPQGADTVVMREQAQTHDEQVRFNAKIKAGQNVRQAGEDLAQGAQVFSAGTRIESAEMGMLASLGLDQCQVHRQLKVAIFSTGDEVQAPGTELQPNTIYDSNRFTLIGLLQALGCEVIDLGIIADDEALMVQALEGAAQSADMVLTSGGVSVGDADYIKLALERLGQIDFWRISMRPGRPLAFGKINNTPFFGLPGNPVAVMVSFINFVEPAIRHMQGQADWTPLKVPAIASESLRSRLGRTEFSRGIYQLNHQGQLTVHTTGSQGSGILRSMSEANCLIEVAPSVESVKPGEFVTIIPLQGRV